jgi:sec-independent protein translocase protein TatC
MSFLEHLEELRKRLMRAVLAIAVAFLLALAGARRILDFLFRPIERLLGTDRPVFLDLTEPFFLYMKVAFLAALFVAAPVVLYQAWAFITPGLYPRERRYALPFVFFATVFFIAGGAFGYYVAFPAACRFFLVVAAGFEPSLRISSLFSFESKMILAMALVFELPTVIYFLSRLGIVTAPFLWHQFKYAVLIAFILAAVITPTPDMITQCIFAIPMIVLYLIGILVAYVFGRERAPRAVADQAAP